VAVRRAVGLLCPSRLALLFLAALSSTGCDRPAAVPRIDYSKSHAYAVAPFKDDAPANAPAPADFPMSFVDSDGKQVDLTTFRGMKVVLVVLRGMPQAPGGVFCPSCLAQTSSLLANQDAFATRGARVVVVFPGPAERIGEFLQSARNQTPGEPTPTFRLCLDRECAACERLGIRDDLARPSTYVLDTKGNLVYAYVGETSTDRPSVKAVLAQLDKTP
jgi:peroxiredoxin